MLRIIYRNLLHPEVVLELGGGLGSQIMLIKEFRSGIAFIFLDLDLSETLKIATVNNGASAGAQLSVWLAWTFYTAYKYQQISHSDL